MLADEVDECPVCQGEGDIGNEECHFCDGYGFLIMLTMEMDPNGRNGWDKLEYTTYLTYLREIKKHFKHSTNEIVIEQGESFFDCPGIPPENQYISIGD